MRFQDKKSMRTGPIPVFSFVMTLALVAIVTVPTSHGQSCGQPPTDPCLDAAAPLSTGASGSDDAPNCSPIVIDTSG